MMIIKKGLTIAINLRSTRDFLSRAYIHKVKCLTAKDLYCFLDKNCFIPVSCVACYGASILFIIHIKQK